MLSVKCGEYRVEREESFVLRPLSPVLCPSYFVPCPSSLSFAPSSQQATQPKTDPMCNPQYQLRSERQRAKQQALGGIASISISISQRMTPCVPPVPIAQRATASKASGTGGTNHHPTQVAEGDPFRNIY